ncbi:WD repeat and FYVE domain-containing protein 2 isoform X3 [Vulpes lagopus]|uniref:WD repeat and FYVE domain-containing protein 2 isoform X3 n=1 Tax=Vulpes lagopus TaxID=494514 RepID=UPI001BC9902C|nr:WD repeat and FYVE domain-containing protein 2 isoform X3 [Vulpes lagopus]
MPGHVPPRSAFLPAGGCFPASPRRALPAPRPPPWRGLRRGRGTWQARSRGCLHARSRDSKRAGTEPLTWKVTSRGARRTVRVWLKRDSGQYWPSIYYVMPSPCSCMSFNPETRRLSIGLDNGTISEFILSEDYNKMTPVRNYQGGVTALCWDPVQRVLFSGSSDHSVIMWDIGGRKGTAIELQGHNDKVQALSYAQHTRQLISCGGDGGIVVWNMDVERQETPEWLDSDSCQKCDQPFFWNFKQMWDSKKIGLRQHHCRKCGKAVCGKCSSKRSSIPLMGFEFEVRVCDSCHEAITDEERAPTATFHDSKHNIVHVHFDATRGWLLTSGTDKVIKLWDMTPVVS